METKVFFLLFYNNGMNCNHWHGDFHHLARRKIKRKKSSATTHMKGFFVVERKIKRKNPVQLR
jgi:hypothetical protein